LSVAAGTRFMIKSELVQAIANKNPHLFLRDVENIVNAIFEEITVALAEGNRVELRGFGAFSVKNRPARTGRNPRTGASVQVEEKWVPFFKTGKELRERLNQESSLVLHKVLTIVVFIAIAIVLIALAVANRALVPFTLDPFNPGNPALTIQWPLFVYLFLSLAAGLIVGSLATWFRQGRYRRLARQRSAEAERLREASAKR